MKGKSVSRWGLVLVALLLALPTFAQELEEDDFIVKEEPVDPRRGNMPAEPVAEAEPWYTLLYKVYTEGHSNQLTEFTNFYFQKGTSFDPAVERDVQYFTLSTKIDFLGNMQPIAVSTVKESWRRIEGGGFRVEQRLRVSDLQGRLRSSFGNILTMSAEGTLLKMEQLPQPPVTDATLLSAWEQEKSEWFSEFAMASAK